MHDSMGKISLVVLMSAIPVWAFAQKQADSVPDFPFQKVYYYNGDSRVDMLLAMDELRVAAPRGQQLDPREVSALAPSARPSFFNGEGVLLQYSRGATAQEQLTAMAAPLRDAGAEVHATLYRVGERREDQTPSILPNRFSLKLTEGISLSGVLELYNLEVLEEVAYSDRTYIVRSLSDDLLAGLDAANFLYEDGLAEFAAPLIQRQRVTRFIPNDPLFSQQWHLQNTGQASGSVPGNDVNITSAWNSYTGAGVNIAIPDSGVEVAHPDLAPNARTDIDLDINGNDGDPTPVGNSHGTSVAGIAAGRGNNAVGVTGAAFEAGIVGIRLLEGLISDFDEATAMGHQQSPANPNDRVHINSNSWGPVDDGARKETFGPLTGAALLNGALNGRGGNGTIFVWAAGNGRPGDNVNYDGYASDKFTIAVGASGGDGVVSFYSEPGASMLVNAPSQYTGVGTTTTTTGGGYTSGFGGTSSAAPLAAGVIALMLEANPNLGWRDVQHILVDTSTQISPASASWATNGSGRTFSPAYGFGRLDATAAVAAAVNWTNVGSWLSVRASETVTVAIPDDSAAGITRTLPITAPENFVAEHVELRLNATHTFRGDLRITLTSPSGASSVLAKKHGDPNGNYSAWKFTSVAHWGEDPTGNWKLNIADREPEDTGSLNNWRVVIFGYVQDTDDVWADTQYTGVEMGDQGRPFDTLNEAVALVNDGGTLHLMASDYNDMGTFDKPMRIEAEGGVARIGG